MSDSIAITGARLIDGTGSAPVDDTTLIVRSGRVAHVGPARSIDIPTDLSAIDATGLTAIPGLIDCHIHLCSLREPGNINLMLTMVTTPPPMIALAGLNNANICLEAGFTTLRDVGGLFNRDNVEMISVRRAIEMEIADGPRLVVGGVMVQTASHLELSGLGRLTPWVNTGEDTADGPWEVRKRVRKLIGLDVDFIKVFASGWGGVVERVWWPNYTPEELAAICDEAHRYGKRVAAHVTTPTTNLNAIIAGCDTLEHLVDIDEEGLALMAERGVFAVPTLSLYSERALARRAQFDSADSVDQIRRTGDIAAETFRRMLDAGVKVATGTDTFRTVLYGENAEEIELMVRYGMSEMDALVATTKHAADALGLADDLGTLTVGKYADLVLVDGDPLADVSILQDRARLLVVMKEGRVMVDRRSAVEKPG